MAVDTLIDPASSLGELVAERPARAELFERLRLDYCCGGRQTLAEACAKREIELDEVYAALHALDASAIQSASIESTDWREVAAAGLCAHIVTVHHGGLRDAFPRLERLFSTVVRVHGGSEPQLGEAQRLFSEIRGELEPHLTSEESELFPACVAYEENGTPVDERVLEEHESEHATLGDGLAALRDLCHDYDRQAARCNTHRALLDGLEAFERDLHRHGHEENNILLPRARQPRATPKSAPRSPASLDLTTATEPAPSLPACCEGWIAEQTHTWVVSQRKR
jgi:regulator of cell morphogenesis and NO signaling